MKTNTFLLYQDGITKPTSEPLKEEFAIEWTKSEAGKYFGVFDYTITDKEKVVCFGFNHLKGGSFFIDGSDTYKVSIEVSDEINGIVLITEKNGVWSDGVLEAGYFGNVVTVIDYNEAVYTNDQLATILHAKSLLVGKGLNNLADRL